MGVIPFLWPGYLCVRTGSTASDPTGPLFRRAQHVAFHVPGVQRKFFFL